MIREKTWRKKSRDTVPLRTHLWMMFCKFLSWASQKALPWKRTVLQYFLKLFNKTGENVAQVVYLERWRKKLIIYSSIYTHYRTGIILYIEYQSVYTFVGIGSPHPLPPSECVSPLGPKKGGATLACGWGGPYSDDRTESMALCKLCALGFSTVCKDDNWSRSFPCLIPESICRSGPLRHTRRWFPHRRGSKAS